MNDSDNNVLLYPVADVNSCPIEVNNQTSPQRRLIMIEPFGSQLQNRVIFKFSRFSEISLSALESQNDIENNINFKCIDLQVL